MLQAIWIVERAYGYLKSTFANAALFNIVTSTLLPDNKIHKNKNKPNNVQIQLENEKRGA